MYSNGEAGAWGEHDRFGEDFYLVPHAEEIWARSEQLDADNQDHLRHFVELAIWRALDLDDRDHLRVLLSLLWLWEDVDPKWLAEASYRSVGDVRDLVESQPVVTFNCLDCGAELTPMNRRHLLRMHHSLKAHHRDGGSDLADLLCKRCIAHRDDHAEEQRRLDDRRQQAILAEYRKRPYAERRQTKEWTILKRQVHRRDGYRCRLCGRDDTELHVHHCTYDNYAQERLEDLITLCAVCHRKARDPVLRSHYQILWLISEGNTTTHIMEVTGYSRGWIQQIARRYNASGSEALGDGRHRNPGAKERALLTEEQQEQLREALKKPPPDGGMWNSPKVGEWIERTTGKVLTQKKQRGWEYMRKLGNSPKVPRPRHKKANQAEQEAFKKSLR